MKFNLPFLSVIFSRPWLIALALTLGLAAWGTLQVIPLLPDNVLTPDQVSAQRLRLNTSQLTALVKRLDAYRHPPAPPAKITNPFITPVTSPATPLTP